MIASGGFIMPIFSDNVHESRGYNRGVRLARGEFVVLLQDDLLPSKDKNWVLQMAAMFEQFPLLGAIGMMSYGFCFHGGP